MLNVYSKIRTFDDSIIKDLNEVLNTTFKVLGQPTENVKYNLYVVSKNFIHELNLSERGVDRATDVLSFPYTDIKAGEMIDISKYSTDIDYVDNSLLLGEIFICNEVAKRQAVKYNHSFKREFCFLFLHGVLHCLGYDHIEESDRVIMEDMQNKILNKCKITRD
ncbi:MAG: rRNA maturation RNase YbeY [Clostridia bacterium]|nr:rRNA maturation RNase YbeY [Clostridia bacterium]